MGNECMAGNMQRWGLCEDTVTAELDEVICRGSSVKCPRLAQLWSKLSMLLESSEPGQDLALARLIKYLTPPLEVQVLSEALRLYRRRFFSDIDSWKSSDLWISFRHPPLTLLGGEYQCYLLSNDDPPSRMTVLRSLPFTLAAWVARRCGLRGIVHASVDSSDITLPRSCLRDSQRLLFCRFENHLTGRVATLRPQEKEGSLATVRIESCCEQSRAAGRRALIRWLGPELEIHTCPGTSAQRNGASEYGGPGICTRRRPRSDDPIYAYCFGLSLDHDIGASALLQRMCPSGLEHVGMIKRLRSPRPAEERLQVTDEFSCLLHVLWETKQERFVKRVLASRGSDDVVVLSATSHNAADILSHQSQPSGLATDLASQLAQRWQVAGGSINITESCLGAFTATRCALRLLRLGRCSLAIVACVDLCDSDFERAALRVGDVTSEGYASPRAFDRKRSGEHVVRGSGCLLLTTSRLPPSYYHDLVHPVVRAGRILSVDNARAANSVGPDRSGGSLLRAACGALEQAKRSVKDLSAVISGASGLIEGDEAEGRGMSSLLNGQDVPVYAPKAALGGALSASGVHLLASASLMGSFDVDLRGSVPVSRETWDNLLHPSSADRLRQSQGLTLITSVGYAGASSAMLMELQDLGCNANGE